MPGRRRESAINKLQSPAFDRRLLSRAEHFEASLNHQWNHSGNLASHGTLCLPITHRASQ